ncbi:hypothetical protein K461DRAFT_272064 [Myriangium duriaei CBS 260.36]|uniref:Uncharacterized protein n=1 Tax=Myriangium duriaei CBS 260.36 TaxID=1168546 RepID=A0A9P4IRY0_9PEZI|nr:hypothetical protein K461DRAFT_272064 [Myriangium duriaei CBS 260.36]
MLCRNISLGVILLSVTTTLAAKMEYIIQYKDDNHNTKTSTVKGSIQDDQVTRIVENMMDWSGRKYQARNKRGTLMIINVDPVGQNRIHATFSDMYSIVDRHTP